MTRGANGSLDIGGEAAPRRLSSRSRPPLPRRPNGGKAGAEVFFVSKQDTPRLRNGQLQSDSCKPASTGCQTAPGAGGEGARGLRARTRCPAARAATAGGGGPAGAGHHVLAGRGGSSRRGRAGGREGAGGEPGAGPALKGMPIKASTSNCV